MTDKDTTPITTALNSVSILVETNEPEKVTKPQEDE